MTIRVLHIDDHVVVRAGVRGILEMDPDIEVVGEAGTGTSGIRLALKLRPDVVLTDLLLPDVDGVAVTQSIRADLPNTKVVILTSVGDEDVAMVRAVRAGAIGYVLKTAEVAELVLAIHAGAEGRVHLSPRAAARLMREMRAPANPLTLTEREREVLRELAFGRSNKEIARSLNIALTTVKSHVRAILDKLGVESRTQAALEAMRSQVLTLDELQPA
jgi:DNA-binding NarL/FixJ family response regulator